MKNRSALSSAYFALAAVLAVPSAAQQAPSPSAQPAATRSVAASIGLERADGVLRAVGPRHKADFRAGGVDFTPRLGAGAPRSLPLSFELESVRVGGTLLLDIAAPREPARPDEAGWLVAYAHAAGITERYEVRREGIEQSFVFTSLPHGRGELVVRGRVATELALPSSGTYAESLEFRAPTGGGVRFGAVLGIDAAGREAAGELRFDGTHLELVLPADFVATAALPLVLDPLIGSIVTVSGAGPVFGGEDVGDPDVAYDATSDQYLVTFERQWSGTDLDVYAQRLSGAGALVGSAIFVETAIATLALNPTATSAHNGGWVVAWQEGLSPFGPFDIHARAISTATGALGATAKVAGTTSSEMHPDAWGPRGYGFSATKYAVIVWEDDSLGIRGARLGLTSATVFTVSSAFTISTSPNAKKPAIARTGSAAVILFGDARTLVVWQRFFDESVDDHDIHGRVIEFDGTPLTPETVILQTVGPDEEDPDVDGDGTNFVVAYERQVGLDTGDNDIRCRRVQYSGSALTPLGGEVVVDADPGLDEIDPAVAFLGPKYAVAWADQVAALDYDIHMRLLDPADCTACDSAEVVLGSTAGNSGRVELASRRSALLIGGTNDDQAMLVWETTDSALPFDGNVLAQRIEAIGAGGAKVNVGGGCGAAGTIGFNGAAAVGNPSVTVTLTGAGAGAVFAFMNVAGGAPPVTCGACVWEPFSPLVVTRAVVGGAANFTSPIPCDPALIGAVLRYQWTVGFVPSTCPFSPDIANTDRLDVTYAE